jgi:hypothetical protein
VSYDTSAGGGVIRFLILSLMGTLALYLHRRRIHHLQGRLEELRERVADALNVGNYQQGDGNLIRCESYSTKICDTEDGPDIRRHDTNA